MINKKQLEIDIYRLKNLESSKKLLVDLNYDDADEPVDKKIGMWNNLIKLMNLE